MGIPLLKKSRFTGSDGPGNLGSYIKLSFLDDICCFNFSLTIEPFLSLLESLFGKWKQLCGFFLIWSMKAINIAISG